MLLNTAKKEEEILILTTESTLLFQILEIQHLQTLRICFYAFIGNRIQSTGLGLAIVKKICDFYGFTLSYHYKVQKHISSVQFN
jgi:hypothetical protein